MLRMEYCTMHHILCEFLIRLSFVSVYFIRSSLRTTSPTPAFVVSALTQLQGGQDA